jgi:hypothetical protein
MSSITVNEGMTAILGQVKGLTEVRDPGGNVLGFFAPASIRNAAAYAGAAAHFDPAEIQRRKELNEPGLTTREVFERLKSITPDEKMQAFLQEKIDRLAERDQCAAP